MTIEHFGRIDLLVNNAGICGSQPFEDATLDDFDHYWRAPRWAGQYGEGCPAAHGRTAAWEDHPHDVSCRLFGMRGQATYAAAKSAVVGLMRILAIEDAERGILVNTISPVAYARMHPAAWSCVPEAEGKATMPVEAVAPAIVWLESDGCSHTNRIYNVEAQRGAALPLPPEVLGSTIASGCALRFLTTMAASGRTSR
jgi:NAD(P)-dependent dehydrogenase (short-subunit alcohol dehydrogenase family)